MIAVENLRYRINAALDLTSQGFKDFCDLPGAGRTGAATATAARAGGPDAAVVAHACACIG
ncbi:hypothetical protein [Streptomyces sp. SCL15-6]|uniref:hypothetical protein n=1 Tax=Streptomyces sp. SCL15-6 TaxID=2967222 RepID=UPI002966C228|nr:hypothetical protein [Streptomyces sp. SCL15-6]